MSLRNLRRKAFPTSALALLSLLAFSVPTPAQQETPPPPSAPRSPVLPKPVERTLKNGLRVIVVERRASPLVTARLVIKNGAEVDPPHLPGLANMTASLLNKGTKTRTAPQIAEEVEALGGSLDAAAQWDYSVSVVTVISSKIDQAADILGDVVRNPSFKEEEIERDRQQTLDDLRVALGQPGAVARYVASRVLFGETPYGHPLPGTLESLERIKRDDIVKLH
ncbi:MAG TPA: pitrilysin family protein, partial [Pyrinomonadaceae bacterium]